MSSGQDAIRTALACQLATLDHRDDDVTALLAPLTAGQLRVVARFLLGTWCEMTRWNYPGAQMRQAVHLDLLGQAVTPHGDHDDDHDPSSDHDHDDDDRDDDADRDDDPG